MSLRRTVVWTASAEPDDIDPPAWLAHAACAGHPEDLWCEPATPPTPRRLAARRAAAVAICHRCPVRQPCLLLGLEIDGSVHTADSFRLLPIFGGLTRPERDTLRSTR